MGWWVGWLVGWVVVWRGGRVGRWMSVGCWAGGFVLYVAVNGREGEEYGEGERLASS